MRILQKTSLIILLLLAFSAQAQQDYPKDVDGCWDNPDSYTDATLIEAGDLEFIRIEIYRQNDTVPAFTATIPDNGEGANQCEVFTEAIPNPGTYRIEGYAIVIGGIESDASIPLFKKYIGKPRSIILRTFE